MGEALGQLGIGVIRNRIWGTGHFGSGGVFGLGNGIDFVDYAGVGRRDRDARASSRFGCLSGSWFVL